MRFRSPRALALCFAVGLTSLSTGAASAQPADAAAAFRATTLNVSAEGETRIRPDMATITIGVTTQAAGAEAAMAANRDRMAQVVAALKARGIAERDVQTSTVSLNAQYAYEQNQPPRLTGYEAANTVTVTVRDLARLGPSLDTVVAAGANQINGIAFGLQNPRTAEDAARRDAVRDVSAKAELYAQASGHRITRLVNLSEGGGYEPGPPRPVMAMARMAEAKDTPVEPGELRVRVQVSAVYEMTR